MTFSVIDGVFQYPSATSPILDGINLQVENGELLAILGPNGAGKTTLMRAMIGLLPWSSGRTEVDGVNLRSMTQKERGVTIAYVPQARSAVTLSHGARHGYFRPCTTLGNGHSTGASGTRYGVGGLEWNRRGRLG